MSILSPNTLFHYSLCCFLLFTVTMSAIRRIDPNSQEELWESIKHTKTVIEKKLNENNEVNGGDDSGDWLKVVAISDTHEQLGELLKDIPNGDILIHSGDFTNAGTKEAIQLFNDQIGSLPHKYKIVVAGNHDLGFDDEEDMSKRIPRYKTDGTPKGYDLLTNCIFLHDKAVEIEGIHVYGSSWHPLPGYSFTLERGEKMAEKWKNIPNETDILITHGPALGYLDAFGTERWGDSDLLREIEERVKPKFHVFGHIHERYGVVSNGITTFINAASCQKANRLNNKPIVFYIKRR